LRLDEYLSGLERVSDPASAPASLKAPEQIHDLERTGRQHLVREHPLPDPPRLPPHPEDPPDHARLVGSQVLGASVFGGGSQEVREEQRELERVGGGLGALVLQGVDGLHVFGLHQFVHQQVLEEHAFADAEHARDVETSVQFALDWVAARVEWEVSQSNE